LSAANSFRVLLDPSAPDSIGGVFQKHGHHVILHRSILPERTPDQIVCAAALQNEAILVAVDGDMKRLVRRYGAASKIERFARLNLILLACNPVLAPQRLEQAMSLIDHEWRFTIEKASRRLWVDIEPHAVRTHR
jgi:predicted nuclease of predicted toxin-antitoxin system